MRPISEKSGTRTKG